MLVDQQAEARTASTCLSCSNQGVCHAHEEANEEFQGREACYPEAQYKSGGEERWGSEKDNKESGH